MIAMDSPPDDAETVVGWVTPQQTDGLWADAADMETATLRSILTAAHEVCVDYLRDAEGDYTEPETIPEGWRLAQVMQARHIWARMRTGNRDEVGPDGYTVSTYPLVLEARTLLRPKRTPFAGLL